MILQDYDWILNLDKLPYSYTKEFCLIKNYKKVKKLTGKSFKWTFICSGIFLTFIVGVFLFYKFVDSNYKSKDENVGNEISGTNLDAKMESEDTSDLDELSKNELERETKKTEKLEPDSNKRLTIGVGVIMLIQVIILTTGLSQFFIVGGISMTNILFTLGICLLTFIIGEFS